MEQQLRIEVIDGVLNISIECSIICHSVDYGIGLQTLEILDKQRFIKALVQQLQSEDEDGTTAVNKMFDSCAFEIAENDDSIIGTIEFEELD